MIRVALGNKESDIWDVISNFHAFAKPTLIQWPEQTQRIALQLVGLGYTIESFFRIAMQPCHALLKLCIWYDRRIPCEQLFFVTKSIEGFCCSFNDILAMKFNKWVVFFPQFLIAHKLHTSSWSYNFGWFCNFTICSTKIEFIWMQLSLEFLNFFVLLKV